MKKIHIIPTDKASRKAMLTKREYFAIHILSGMNANGMTTQEGVQPPYCMLIEERVKYAVEQADTLLAELEKNNL
jgi:hypothetical protein